MPPSRRIGTMFAENSPLTGHHHVLRSIAKYAASRGNWELSFFSNHIEDVDRIRKLKLDGIIASPTRDETAKALAALRIPVVSISARREWPFPAVSMDNVAAGEMAAGHLLDVGFRHFAFVGWDGVLFSTQRQKGFEAHLATKGLTARIHLEKNPDPSPLRLGAAFRKWLRELPKPIGLLCCNDSVALHIAAQCRLASVQIPQALGLLGVDDALACEISTPPLSSVRLPWERIGHEAASLLDQVMAGRSGRKQRLLLPPEIVIARQSTNILLVPDSHVVEAILYIRGHAGEPIGVKNILDSVRISRRSLERRFQDIIGRTLHEEIHLAHMERAREMLIGTRLPIHEVARLSGFTNAVRFSSTFRKAMNLTPGEYRRRFGRL